MFERLDDSCEGTIENLSVFLISNYGLSITYMELNWQIILEWPLFNNFSILWALTISRDLTTIR